MTLKNRQRIAARRTKKMGIFKELKAVGYTMVILVVLFFGTDMSINLLTSTILLSYLILRIE